MGNVGDIERITQNRVVKLFKEKLKYTYLGNWEDRQNNSNIEEELLTGYLTKKGYSPAHITKALYELRVTASNYNESLYTNNKNVYKLLRYGIQVKAKAGENFETVRLINWQNPGKNDFAIAEEVTVLALSVHEKVVTYRPDNWKGNEIKELVIKSKLYEVLGDKNEVERIFSVVKQQDEY